MCMSSVLECAERRQSGQFSPESVAGEFRVIQFVHCQVVSHVTFGASGVSWCHTCQLVSPVSAGESSVS